MFGGFACARWVRGCVCFDGSVLGGYCHFGFVGYCRRFCGFWRGCGVLGWISGVGDVGFDFLDFACLGWFWVGFGGVCYTRFWCLPDGWVFLWGWYNMSFGGFIVAGGVLGLVLTFWCLWAVACGRLVVSGLVGVLGFGVGVLCMLLWLVWCDFGGCRFIVDLVFGVDCGFWVTLVMRDGVSGFASGLDFEAARGFRCSGFCLFRLVSVWVWGLLC